MPGKIHFERIEYEQLDSRQQENYNFQKLSAVLADYGFSTIRLTADWNGADFIAQHKDGLTFLKVQLKGRLTFGKKYQDQDLYVAFRDGADWYLYPHDELLEEVQRVTTMSTTESWTERGGYSFPRISQEIQPLLSLYHLKS